MSFKPPQTLNFGGLVNSPAFQTIPKIHVANAEAGHQVISDPTYFDASNHPIIQRSNKNGTVSRGLVVTLVGTIFTPNNLAPPSKNNNNIFWDISRAIQRTHKPPNRIFMYISNFRIAEVRDSDIFINLYHLVEARVSRIWWCADSTRAWNM